MGRLFYFRLQFSGLFENDEDLIRLKEIIAITKKITKGLVWADLFQEERFPCLSHDH